MDTRKPPYFNNEDRNSKLPETLIHHILSFIDMKHAVKTCILSRRWRYIWTSLPTLNLNSNLFYSREPKRFYEFLDFVDSVLILRDISDIQRFDLVWHEKNGSMIISRLKTWILAALRRNVQELSINLVLSRRYSFPPCLFTSSSLTKLELIFDPRFHSDIIPPDSISLPRLKSLTLGSVSIVGENFPDKLFSNCPVLESLIITNSCLTDTDMNLNISSIKRKHVKLDMFASTSSRVRTVTLDAPNLTSFICKAKDYMFKNYSLENLSSLVTAEIKMILKDKGEKEMGKAFSNVSAKEKESNSQHMMEFLRALHHVKDLTLSQGILEVVSGAPDLLDSRPAQFYNLRRLKLQTRVSRNCMHAISYFLKICPNMESLFLRISETMLNSASVGDYWEAGFSFPCMFYHLKFVEIRGVCGSVTELKFLESLLKNAIVLEKVALFSCKTDSPDRVSQLMKFSEKLLAFPSASSRIAILFFQS